MCSNSKEKKEQSSQKEIIQKKDKNTKCYIPDTKIHSN